jgi:sarcosine oxidase
VLDGAEVARRFPQFLNLAGDEKAYYEPGGGYVFPERCLAAQPSCAAAAGAEIRTGCKVRALSQNGAGIRIETEDGAILADRAVVAAGAWTAPLLGSPFDRLLTVRRQLLHWYALADASAYGPQAPVFIWMYGTTDTEYLYGFPPLPGERAIKVATEQYDTATTADGVERRVDPSESDEMYRLRVAGRLAGATPEVVRTAACVYTVTPDRGFIIDRHPGMDRLWVVSACSGHGFKHSAGIGEAVAAELAGGPGRVDLAPFALARFG